MAAQGKDDDSYNSDEDAVQLDKKEKSYSMGKGRRVRELVRTSRKFPKR